MVLSKLRTLVRLQQPAGDEGADTGGTDVSSQTNTDNGATLPPSDPVDTSSSEPSDQGADNGSETASEEPSRPVDKLNALLDTLSEGDDKGDDEGATDDATGEPKPEPGSAAAEADKAPETKTPEQEEAELLEGVKSDRGKERIKQMFAERKQLERDLNDFREMVVSTGMSPQDFSQTLEYGRLVASGDEKNLRVALEMLESQRAMIYSRLGVEAPGVDLLKEHADLQSAVDNMEMTRERALELAKYRKIENERVRAQQAQQTEQQSRMAFDSQIKQAANQIDAYLSTRANEVDHAQRMASIMDYFKNPERLQEFVKTYQPQQWASTIKFMYDNIKVQRQPARTDQQPLRSRPNMLGNPSASGQSPADRIAAHLDNLGI